MGFTPIGRLEDFPPGQIQARRVNGLLVCVVNMSGKLYAVSGLCTHEYVELSYGYVVGKQLFCGQHDAGFDLETGEVVRGPAEFDLRVYSVKVEGEEVLLSTDSQ